MLKYAYDGVIVKVLDNGFGFIPEEEAKAYVDRARELHGSKVTEVIVKVDLNDPDMVDLEYKWDGEKFHRLRRITGYLVGNLSRWNNGKRAEERDRVKHNAEVSE